MKAKSKAFQAFKMFKVYVNNHFRCKTKALQMTRVVNTCLQSFRNFVVVKGLSEGILCTSGLSKWCCRVCKLWHAMSDDISAMLAESNLHPQFWGECLAAQVHV
ncbi:hypothetical protein OBBRIDRAFT_851506 [Obba rivulosa]|uniref:Uncharacterized protein n=1 Tax=Obba rivulosa TaxID=1052685 RepID=A0A8E2AMS0_9APHY|nr:hypothetical protein OBBRIDRAFT_851506 [Obba rivulosa]